MNELTSYDALSDYVNKSLYADTIIHDNHVWTYYLYVLDNLS